MATYQLENAHKTKLWMKVVAVLLAAVMVIGALVELLCQTSMVKNRLEVSAMMSGYTKALLIPPKQLLSTKRRWRKTTRCLPSRTETAAIQRTSSLSPSTTKTRMGRYEQKTSPYRKSKTRLV